MKSAFSFVLRLFLLVVLAVGLVLPAAAAPAAPDGGQLVLLSKLDGPPLPEDLNILEDYGAFVLAQLPEAQIEALPEGNVMDQMTDRTVISLNGWVWDTQGGEPAIAEGLAAADDDPYFLVQFYAPVKNGWVETLEALGVKFLGYHPNYTYIVKMDPALADTVRAAHAVQWVGRYHPAYRLAVDDELAKAKKVGDGRVMLEVRGFPDDVDTVTLQAELEKAGASVWLSEAVGPPVIRVWARPELSAQLATLPGVYRVEAYDEPTTNNDKAGQSAHTWDVWKQGRNGLLQDLMGAGQTAGNIDSGLDNKSTSPTIEDFYDYTGGTTTSRVVYNANSAACGGSCSATDNASGHGTHTSGTIVGNGYNSLAQRGLTGYATAANPSFDYAWAVGQAPEAKIAVVHAGTSSGSILTTPATDWVTLYNQGARNVNNSWGNSTYSYGGNSQTADNVMWTYQDHLIVASAGNTGPISGGAIAQPANAKNIISVGAANNHRPALGWYADTAATLAYFSARGPVTTGSTGDTRFKPDMVAAGAQVLSTRTNQIAATTEVLWGNEAGIDGGDGDGDNDNYPDYAWSGGTSMSAPQITGASTIVRDYFQDIQGLGSTTPPSAALIKVALLNGAMDMGYGYETYTTASGVHYGGRNMQGWGYLNLEQALTPRAPRSFFFDDFTNITGTTHQSTMGTNGTGDYVQYTVSVTDSSEPLKVTLTWTDYQGGSSGYAVNNLNLLVTSPGSTQYYGNNFSGSWSVTGGTYDAVNNTEAVYLQNPGTGTWTIRVTDASHGNGTQPFALYVSGGLGTNPSWSRTCSGTAGTCANAHGGTSGQTYGGTAVNYFPSLKPLSQGTAQVVAGNSTASTFRLTNWGRSTDNISLSYAVTDKTGAAAANISVVFSPTGPFTSLASGGTQDVTATVSVGSGVAAGAYDVLVTATSANTGNRKDAIVIPLNVMATITSLDNQSRAVSQAGPQVTSDFWASGSTLWAAYLSGENHNNDEAEVWASCSTDGGVTWTNVGQVDNGDGAVYYGPVVAGNSSGSSVTFVWLKPNLAVYARTWTRTSGCTGTWRSIQTLATYAGGNYRISYPDVIYDTDGTILAVWRKNDNATGGTDGIFSNQSTTDGASWGTAVGVPNASGTDATHLMPQLALDTTNNDVWMAYQNSANSGDIYVKRWLGSTNAWAAADTNHVAVATTTNVETRPGIGYVAATSSLWVTWHRYASVSNPSALLYYTRSNAGTLPTPTWGTTYQYPTGVRTAEEQPAMVVGDGAWSYITYEAYSDGWRGNNIYTLKAPAAGGAPNTTCQQSATVDDPPLYARGNAGSPKLMWATTTLNGSAISGPALLYSKNPPSNGDPVYTANLGVSQTLYNLEENFDLYLCQVCTAQPLAVELAGFNAAATADGVTLAWETVSETDNLGFNVYRADAAGGPWTQVNAELIPALTPGSTQGNVYTWTDTTAPAGTTWYMLEDVALDGTATQHEPVSVTVAEPNSVGMTTFGAAGAALPALGGLAGLALAAVALSAIAGVRLRKRR